MNLTIEQLLLSLSGFVFHLLQMYKESHTRNEEFINKSTGIYVAMNLVAIPTLIYLGKSLPEDLIVMSPFTCVLIGYFGANMLSGFINVKKPKDVETFTYQKTITKEGTEEKIDADIKEPKK